MFRVPESVLDELKCNLCDGYLNAKPVVLKDGKQICAKCYKILPNDEVDKCARQVTFEAIGSCLIFPCRYHKMGCDYTFTWNNENGHETECKKKYFTVPDIVATNENITETFSESVHLNEMYGANNAISLSNEFKQRYVGKYGKTKNEAVPHFSNDLTNSSDPLIPNECNNNTITSVSLYENIYSTIPSISSQTKTIALCLSCNAQVDKTTKNVCLFGHISCNNCKSDMCIACVKNLDGNSRIACKNASEGCKELLYQSDVGFHRDNCEFNKISCPFDKCREKDVLPQLINHLKEDHGNKVIVSTEISKSVGQKDQNIVFLCHESVFKCLYYYYVTSVEIFVVYWGPCVKASDFHFEVCVEVNRKLLKKKLMCANWNNYMLASGVSFDKKELQTYEDQPIKFELNLKILRAN